MDGIPSLMYGFPMSPDTHPDVKRLLVALTVLKLEAFTESGVREALGMPYGTWRDRRNAGRILDPEILIGIARSVGANPVALMVECGALTHQEAIEYVEAAGGDHSPTRATTAKGVKAPPKRKTKLSDTPVIRGGKLR